jgi:hypothetical protein
VILREVRCGFFQERILHLELAVSPFKLLQACTLTNRQICTGGRLVLLLMFLHPAAGEQPTRFATNRAAFAWRLEGVEIDITVLDPAALDTACRMIAQIRTAMTATERIAFTWVKHLLLQRGHTAAYQEWKHAPYRRYCPEFSSGG